MKWRQESVLFVEQGLVFGVPTKKLLVPFEATSGTFVQFLFIERSACPQISVHVRYTSDDQWSLQTGRLLSSSSLDVVQATR